MGTMACQITNLTIVYPTVYSGADQRKHQSSASLGFVRGPVNSPHKWSVTRKMFPFDDVIMPRSMHKQMMRHACWLCKLRPCGHNIPSENIVCVVSIGQSCRTHVSCARQTSLGSDLLDNGKLPCVQMYGIDGTSVLLLKATSKRHQPLREYITCDRSNVN